MKSQKENIKTYLLQKKSITPLQALNKFGCFRLAAVIYKLKDEGMKITTEIIHEKRKQYAKYSIV